MERFRRRLQHALVLGSTTLKEFLKYTHRSWRSLGLVITLLTVVAVVSASTLDGPTSARANSYDDGWQSDWIAHASSLLRSAANQKTDGFVLALGDSITHSYAFAVWPVSGAGKTLSDADVTSWAHTGSWGANNFDVTQKNGWYLAAADTTSQRGLTSSGGLTLQEFVVGCCNGGPAMPVTSDPIDARSIVADPTYAGNLQVDTVISAFNDAQIAVVMLGTNDPGNSQNIANLHTIVDRLEAEHIVPILSTIPPRGDGFPNDVVVQFNAAVTNLAFTRSLPLIDYYQEIVLRRPGTSWMGTLISSDGVHPTGSGAGFGADSDPYLPGGDPDTHMTGEAAANVGYLLRSWLVVQKLKEVRQHVVDAPNVPPSVSVTSPAAGSTYSAPATVVVAAAADDSDGSIGKVEFYANGSLVATDVTSPFEATWNNVAPGSYLLMARAIDDRGARTDSGTVAITVNAPPPQTMHVGDLDGAPSGLNKQTWKAVVTVTIHDAAEANRAGVRISGYWSGGYSGTVTCTTSSSGSCQVSTGTINVKKTSATFTVDTLSHATLVYQRATNHDVDNGSNGTAITVAKP